MKEAETAEGVQFAHQAVLLEPNDPYVLLDLRICAGPSQL